ncbi:MAG: carbohydrate ABC transporter permease [Clostridia bacterium]|jgi:multiple sugar transport system permease protein|nr:carbohydrate ABC transporter permease [Clostridia bacterium]
MNAQNAPKITKETKDKIRVEFDRTSKKERMRIKYLSSNFVVSVVWWIFRFIILLGLAYVVLMPFFSKITGSFMSPEDFIDVTVKYIPKYPTLDTYKAIIAESKYGTAFINTIALSLFCGVTQTFICSLIGYGFAKFKFKGSMLLFLLVVLTMVIPHQTLQLSLFMKFRYFDILGVFNLLGGGLTESLELIPFTSINLNNSYWPLALLSITGLAYRNGLYIFMMRQFYRGVPDELEESAYLDGCGTFMTFFRIIIPLSVPMMVTIFLFAFCWQWTDDFYTTVFFTSSGMKLMPDIIMTPKSLDTDFAAGDLYISAIRNTCGLLVMAPLIVVYLFGQRFLVQGIERSGIVG